MISKIFGLILLLPLVCFAAGGEGGWISSGGESFHDAKNPWFLANAQVSYCLEIDETAFSTAKDEMEAIVSSAIEYWQKEFAKESGPVLGHVRKSFKLGHNKFIHKDSSGCSGDEDVRFLFGSKSLSEREKQYLKEGNQNYVGVAVRTDYDRKSLRGRGFIFIASNQDIDSHSLSSDTIKQPWSHEKLLKLALIHEIGHVFGIPHMGSSLMSEVFMDLLLSKYYYQDFIKAKIESFVSSEKEITRCTFITPEMTNFFGLKLDTSCLNGKWKDSKTFEIYAIRHGFEPELVGMAISLEVDFFGIESRPLAFLRLTSEQTVFTSDQVNHRSLVAGPLQERYSMKGKLIAMKYSKSYPVLVSVSPESFTLNSTLNGKISTVFSYDSPFSSILGQTLDLKL